MFVDKPVRVRIVHVDGLRPSSYFKPGQYGYVVGSTTHGGMHLMDRAYADGAGVSQPGEEVYLVAKTKEMKGGALWFSGQGIQASGRRKNNMAGWKQNTNVSGQTYKSWKRDGGNHAVDDFLKEFRRVKKAHGVSNDIAARYMISHRRELSYEVMEIIGLHPSSEPELAALQRQWG